MTTIQHKRGTADRWLEVNPVLAEGEIGLETDTLKVKFGDGVSTWSSLSYFTGSGGIAGTVTSVGLTVPTGLTVSGSPVTTAGTLAVSFDTGYSIPTTASQTNWDTAYGWGNHSSAGYALLTATQTFTGTNTFTNAATNAKALVINNISGTSVNLFEVQANSNAYLYLTSGGSLYNSGRLLVRADYSATFNVGVGSSTQVGAIIRGATSQTANLQEWQNNAGTILASISSGGIPVFSRGVYANDTATDNVGLQVKRTLFQFGTVASEVGVVVRGAASQTADLQQWQNSSGVVLAEIDASGNLTANNFIPTYIQSTAPTSTPAKYMWWDTTGGDLTLWIEDGT